MFEWLRSSDTEGSEDTARCSGHHWDKPPTDTHTYRIKETRDGYEAQRQVQDECKHSGCRQTRTRWVTITAVGESHKQAWRHFPPPDDMARIREWSQRKYAAEALGKHLCPEDHDAD